jgi:hypothetical protein
MANVGKYPQFSDGAEENHEKIKSVEWMDNNHFSTTGPPIFRALISTAVRLLCMKNKRK